MCGIAGYFKTQVDEATCRHVMGALKHRGPDDDGMWMHADVGFIHTRLSILDLSKLGSQPYRYKHLTLTFNGELYNFREVREELTASGYTFESNSDTEVLIKAFDRWGIMCVDRFIGMFAFGIYDEKNDALWLARDRVGVKPLYFSDVDGKFFFASELKALMRFPVSKDVNPDAVAMYFRFGFVPGHLSIYSQVSKLEPGHWLKVSRYGVTSERYWLTPEPQQENKNEKEWIDDLEQILISAFKYRMVSDVPVGVFLSGGIDSSLLTAILQRHHGGIHTFTIGFNESRFDESSHADKVARHLKTVHFQKTLLLDEARTLLHNFYDIYDEPFADTSGIPTACVTELARQSGMHVVLSADGGDELFGGYTHYQTALQLFRRLQGLPKPMRNAAAKAMKHVLSKKLRREIRLLNFGHKAFALEELLETDNIKDFFESYIANQSIAELQQMLSMDFKTTPVEAVGRNELETMMAWDFKAYLPDDLLVKVDRATMHYGIECREPMLDHRIAEFSMRMPSDLKIKDGQGKYILRQLLKRYLPTEFFERQKQGFSIPLFEWFRKDLDQLFDRYLSKERIAEVPYLNVSAVTEELIKYRHYKQRNKEYNIEKMWRIVSFMLWWDAYQN